MPAKQHEDWTSLTAAVQNRCKQILDKQVAPIAKRIVKEHIQTDIYDAYTPKENGWVLDGEPATYERRYSLLKRGTLYHTFIKDDEILITNDVKAMPSIVKGWSFRHRYPGAFLKLLEIGNMGIWHGGFPRPAISNAQKEIDKSSEIRKAIQRALDN